MSSNNRKFPRLRVHIRVSYKRGDKHVERFAENLSAGGAFIPDAEALVPNEIIAIEIELPKRGTFRVKAEVMHVTNAGAGLQLKSPPAVFATALAAYLKQLEQRTDAKVYVDADPWRRLLSDAGYRVLPLPPPHELVGVIGDAQAIGLLAPEDIAESYRNALGFLGEDGSLVIAINDKLPAEPVLACLDDKLFATTSVTSVS